MPLHEPEPGWTSKASAKQLPGTPHEETSRGGRRACTEPPASSLTQTTPLLLRIPRRGQHVKHAEMLARGGRDRFRTACLGPSSPVPLYTRVRGRSVLRSPEAELHIGPRTPTDPTTSNTQGPDLEPLYIAHRHKDALGQHATPLRTLMRGGRQESQPPVCYQRPGPPDRGVRRSRFEGS